MNVGISHIAFSIPKLYLDVENFSKYRQIDAEKLKKGLGIYKMAFLDHHQDTATLAANALLDLVQTNQLDPRTLDRIYLSTESGLDSSKPTATYAVQMVEKQLESQFGERCFKHTDVVDMTFACIGGVDVSQNTLDYVRVNQKSKAVVIASDYAKYALNSPGEYTQGAGAVAMLVETEPKLISFNSEIGIGFKSEHDFFKPRRFYSKAKINGKAYDEDILQVFRDDPVFDGQFSNNCYQDRIREAYFNLKDKLKLKSTEPLFNRWRSIIFHLPYAFHGKRIFTEIYGIETKPQKQFSFEDLKALGKSNEYREFVNDKITAGQKASSEIGNLYSASIFMALISDIFYKQEKLNVGDQLGFIAYGSGSKSKVFQGKLTASFLTEINKTNLKQKLDYRKAISFATYKDLHQKTKSTSVLQPKNEFALEKIETTHTDQLGARFYTYQT
ncbi:hydroxymethylglutaryl-CoA synthase [Psychroflexus salarius]|uniref:Hydroxymethylglutaryl-CoA synthase n=1 Tax=Psychroflexus salarius TaxID=1155689 RepID=A0A1M4STD2_9FLAO|nr:hydroxymethylglutaryl-CoA synthase [Psychroflexus salarius]SHE35451.1 hydroxymethylglutaryl-CoA synthase [Psychroflexus salarius]